MNENNRPFNYEPTNLNGDTAASVSAGPGLAQAGQSLFQEQVPGDQMNPFIAAPNQQIPYTQNQYAPHPPYCSAQPSPQAYPFVPPTPIFYTGQVPIPPKKRVTAGTFLIPLGFMFLHVLVLGLASALIGLIVGFKAVTSSTLDLQKLEEQILSQSNSIQVYSLLMATPILIGIYVLMAFLLKRRSRPYVYFQAPPLGDTLRAIVIAIGCLGVANLIMLLLQELAKSSSFIDNQYKIYMKMTGTLGLDVNIFVMALTICILVPIAEELLFRGLIAGEFRRAMPDWLNILINGVLFALFHMNFIQSSYVLLAGLALAAVGLWSRSIWVPIILHAVYNFCGSVALVLIGDNPDLQGLFFIIQLACILLGIGFAIWSYRRRKKDVLMVYP